MLKGIIIDDEITARLNIEKLVQMYLGDILTIEGTTDNLRDGIGLIKNIQPHIVFLDISMPSQSGLELFNYFDTISFEVIFVTAHEQFAINAVGLGAASYILKPIKPKLLVDAVLKIKIKFEKNSNPIDENWKYNFTKLMVNHQKGIHIIPFNEIIAISADGNYSKIFKSNGEELFVTRTLGNIEDQLPNSFFFRTHRSSIVNLNYITEINKESGVIILNQLRQPLADKNIKPLIEKLNKVISEKP